MSDFPQEVEVNRSSDRVCPDPDCIDGWIAYGSGEPWVKEGDDPCPICNFDADDRFGGNW